MSPNDRYAFVVITAMRSTILIVIFGIDRSAVKLQSTLKYMWCM
jgi:hypothetical protein